MDFLPIGAWAALAGLITGSAFGLAARLGDFCTLGALESAVWGGDQRRLRLWGIVLATAIATTQGLALAGLIDITASQYHRISWSLGGSLAGGLIFGYGMALAGNCGFGALARAGGGDIRALIVAVVMGISGFFVLSGPAAPLRLWLFPQDFDAPPQGILHDAAQLGLSPVVVVLLLFLGLLGWALSCAPLRHSPRMILWGVVAGLAVTFAFWSTSRLAAISLDAVPVEGPSFTAPLGRAILYVMTSSGSGLSFSTGLVFGVILGGLGGALLRGLFRWEACEDPRELGRQLSGAVLMGIGGVIAIGCSVGQGLSGFAALAWSGPVTLAAISLGGLIGLRRLIGGDAAVD